jgi:hypothetical protein
MTIEEVNIESKRIEQFQSITKEIEKNEMIIKTLNNTGIDKSRESKHYFKVVVTNPNGSVFTQEETSLTFKDFFRNDYIETFPSGNSIISMAISKCKAEIILAYEMRNDFLKVKLSKI